MQRHFYEVTNWHDARRKDQVYYLLCIKYRCSSPWFLQTIGLVIVFFKKVWFFDLDWPFGRPFVKVNGHAFTVDDQGRETRTGQSVQVSCQKFSQHFAPASVRSKTVYVYVLHWYLLPLFQPPSLVFFPRKIPNNGITIHLAN